MSLASSLRSRLRRLELDQASGQSLHADSLALARRRYEAMPVAMQEACRIDTITRCVSSLDEDDAARGSREADLQARRRRLGARILEIESRVCDQHPNGATNG